MLEGGMKVILPSVVPEASHLLSSVTSSRYVFLDILQLSM
jgi:hypothetical protein